MDIQRTITVTSIEEMIQIAVGLTKEGAAFTCRLNRDGWVFNITGY